MHRPRPGRSRLAVLAVVVAALLALSGCSFGIGAGGAGLALVGFAAPKAGHDLAREAWADTPAGNDVGWRTSFGASGDQSRAVASGLHADVVHFSLPDDMERLVTAGVVAGDWAAGPDRGVVSDSVVVLVVRNGNPKNVRGWEDLVRPDVSVVTPNPGSSGAARWNVLAAWGHVIAGGGSEAEATDFLTRLLSNTAALPGSSRDATTAFTTGTGDVLISYENEAIFARAHGEDFEYLVPDTTLLIENPAAVTVDAAPEARDYLEFLHSEAGQRAFTEVGFRPRVGSPTGPVVGAMNPTDPFPEPRVLQTIDADFGGWAATNEKFFPADGNGVLGRIQQAVGTS